jgi:hypothetical protein
MLCLFPARVTKAAFSYVLCMQLQMFLGRPLTKDASGKLSLQQCYIAAVAGACFVGVCCVQLLLPALVTLNLQQRQ